MDRNRSKGRHIREAIIDVAPPKDALLESKLNGASPIPAPSLSPTRLSTTTLSLLAVTPLPEPRGRSFRRRKTRVWIGLWRPLKKNSQWRELQRGELLWICHSNSFLVWRIFFFNDLEIVKFNFFFNLKIQNHLGGVTSNQFTK